MKNTTRLLGYLAISMLLIYPLWAEPSAKMNTVLIICDDLGVGDVGCYYAKDNPTPFLDKLAASGLVHNRFYTYTPSCSPSRATLLTGKDARTVGVDRVLMGSNKHSLEKSSTTLGELFKRNGFKTGFIGKWHLGYGEDHDPLNHGFDYFFGHRGGKIDYYKYTDSAQKYEYDLWENRTPAYVDEYCTTEFANRSAHFIAQNALSPFFLYVSLNAPHWDNNGSVPAPKEYMATLGPNPTPREIYVGAMKAIDDCVKTIIEKLRQHKLMDNTVFIFTSDQGAWLKAGGSNGPLRGGKAEPGLFEGALRIPYIMLWPGRNDELKAITKPADLSDVFPTLAANMGFRTDLGHYMGQDLFSPDERPIYFYSSRLGVQHEGWKLYLSKKPNGPMSLFNLANDPFEKNNLIKQAPERGQELLQLLTEYNASVAQRGRGTGHGGRGGRGQRPVRPGERQTSPGPG